MEALAFMLTLKDKCRDRHESWEESAPGCCGIMGRQKFNLTSGCQKGFWVGCTGCDDNGSTAPRVVQSINCMNLCGDQGKMMTWRLWES